MNLRLIIVAVAAGGLAASALSLYVAGRRDGAELHRDAVAALTQARDAARLEAEGERAAQTRLSAALARSGRAEQVTAAFIPQALNTEDGHAPLDAARAARLHDADRQLCQAAPELAGCPEIEPGG
ncbi:hypothetical protein [Phenylobacterium sp.]|uniref:hypothetical protein n=1 Tax=Phenylobacterium sp. TaxID=1871053 RepID=UPI002731A8DB|nr:hypothetical protein [Phenylobacterium sp.]MDP1616771.1 hypothetical protein [Phenylobacterium sp.]MDP1988283.1 hypothetical protein [Phenylobacterium sp.]